MQIAHCAKLIDRQELKKERYNFCIKSEINVNVFSNSKEFSAKPQYNC